MSLPSTSALLELFPAARESVYLNAGTSGPLFAGAASSIVELAQTERTIARSGAYFLTYRSVMQDARRALAQFVGAENDEIALTHNTTEGMNIVIWGLRWKAGDEVITTTLEHEGGLLPLYELHRRFGVKVTFADIDNGARDVAVSAITRLLRPGVKLLVLSHVMWSTGAVLPLREIVEAAHAHGIEVLVDGAQSVGAIPLNLREIGADYYAFSGQKWLCGPQGTGALYVRREKLESLRPTFMGYIGTDLSRYRPNDVTASAPVNGAQRYEVGGAYLPSYAGLTAAVEYLRRVPAIFNNIFALADYCLDRLQSLPDVEILTPKENHAGLVALRLPRVNVDSCVNYLSKHDVLVRSIPDNGALRISCGFYNNESDIDRAISLISAHMSNSDAAQVT